MEKGILEIDLIKQDVIEKINDANLEILLALQQVFEGPKQNKTLEILTVEQKLNKAHEYKLTFGTIPRKEKRIAKDLIKFINSVVNKIDNKGIKNRDQELSFSPNDPEIKKFLDQSDIVKERGLETRFKILEEKNITVLGIFSADKKIILENGNICLRYCNND